jgi:hypothetical protein
MAEFNGFLISSNSQSLSAQFNAKSWGDTWDATGQLATLADEIQALDDGTMAVVLASMNSEEAKQTLEQNYFSLPNTFSIILQGQRETIGQSIARGVEFRDQLKLMPTGTKGPEIKNRLRGWGKYYGQFISQEAKDLNPQYDASLHGGILGYDKSVGNLLLGASGGAGNYLITDENDVCQF